MRKQNQRQGQLRQDFDGFPVCLERNQIQTDRADQKPKRGEYDGTADPRPFNRSGNAAVNKNKYGKNG
jgi:hypothetical protein